MMDMLRLTDVLSRLPSRMVDKDIVVLVDIDCPLCTDKKLFLLNRPTGQFEHLRSIDLSSIEGWLFQLASWANAFQNRNNILDLLNRRVSDPH